MSAPLKEADPELFDLILKEQHRQRASIELIASENYTSRAVQECLGSCLTNKYSEGQPHARYYGGNEYIDQIELLCKARALAAFGLSPDTWAANVQPYSGSPANMGVYTALLRPHDRIMGLGLPDGGHLTHGFYTAKKKVSATSIFFESLPYHVGPDGILDYDALARSARDFLPRLIVAGASAYPREWDWARLRAIADEVGAVLMADMAHISGLVAAGVHSSPFPHCHVVTTTTHKTLRGPRSGIIFCRKDYEEAINNAVFPGLQGGPHNHQIAAVATQLREVASPEFRAYAATVVANAKVMAAALQRRGLAVATGGTDNHIVLWDVRPLGLTGSKLQVLFENIGISLNKNALPGDTSPAAPGGVRLGTPAITSRGFEAAHVEQVVEFLQRGAQMAVEIQERVGKKLRDFEEAVKTDAKLQELKGEIEAFALQFPLPGLHYE